MINKEESAPVSTWTVGRYRAFITSCLRGGFRRYPNKYAALKAAFAGRLTNKKTGREAAHYKCNTCKELFPQKEVQVDHIKPVVDPKKGFVSWDVFIERLFCEQDNLQILCKICHKEKSSKEKTRRRS